MLSTSAASTSLDNPFSVDESSQDFEIVLLIIVGKGEEASKRVTSWTQAENLYRIGKKYRIDSQRHWFSRMCAQSAAQEPWEALFLACNVSPMDTDIIKPAIAEGFQRHTVDKICDPRYFQKMQRSPAGNRCWSTMQISNITTLFGFRLGLPGLLAYRHTLSTILSTSTSNASTDYQVRTWESIAQEFVRNVEAVEKARDNVSFLYASRYFRTAWLTIFVLKTTATI
jgi:hypothetical protein